MWRRQQSFLPASKVSYPTEWLPHATRAVVGLYKNKKYFFYITFNVIYIFILIILFGRFRNLTSFHRSVCSFCVTRSTATSSSLKSEKVKFIKTTKTLYIHL